jgi:hypothetical protein
MNDRVLIGTFAIPTGFDFLEEIKRLARTYNPNLLGNIAIYVNGELVAETNERRHGSVGETSPADGGEGS